VAALRRYSLAAPAGDRPVQVHRLVRAVTRAQLTTAEANHRKQAAAAVVEAAIPADGRPPAAWKACALLLPHARAILDRTTAGMGQIGHYLGNSGSYAAARDLCVLIADAHRDSGDHGPAHPSTLAARRNLARWTGQAGDAAGARDQHAALLPLYQRILGPQHPGTLSTRRNLARWTGQAGDAAWARDHMVALLPVYEGVLGPEHPDTLTIRHDLAHWAGETGDAG
jgi:Tetratricopeptide repeat